MGMEHILFWGQPFSCAVLLELWSAPPGSDGSTGKDHRNQKDKTAWNLCQDDRAHDRSLSSRKRVQQGPCTQEGEAEQENQGTCTV
jgi:hypothetical protein